VCIVTALRDGAEQSGGVSVGRLVRTVCASRLGGHEQDHEHSSVRYRHCHSAAVSRRLSVSQLRLTLVNCTVLNRLRHRHEDIYSALITDNRT